MIAVIQTRRDLMYDVWSRGATIKRQRELEYARSIGEICDARDIAEWREDAKEVRRLESLQTLLFDWSRRELGE